MTFNISSYPDLFKNTDPKDPLFPLTVAAVQELAVQTDFFIRACVRKVLSPDSLALFVDTKAPVPGLDMFLELQTPYKRKLTLKFNGAELGRATFETKLSLGEVVHEVSDVWI